jgi:UDP-2,3-diacylglucosamine hydrolase
MVVRLGMSAEPLLYIAGDVHADGKSGPFLAFLDQLARRSPARLVILGDLVEYWLETDGSVERHRDVLGRLKALRSAGWQLDVVRGNREIIAGRRLEIATGCRLSWPRLDVQLGPTRLRIVHGDRLCHDPGYRLYSAFMRGFWMRGLQAVHPPQLQELIARGLRAHSQSVQRQHRKRPGRARVFIDPRRVTAAGRGADVLIAGHIHEAWRRRIGGVDLMLVGDWPDRMGHWIEGFADGRLVARVATFAEG